MSSFALLFICVQACLFHNAFSQCLAGPGVGYAPGYGPNYAPGYGAAPGLVGPYGAIAPGYPGYGPASPGPALGTYGGAGTGDVTVIGELPVAGTTVVTGQVPILGAVQFGGPVVAAGAVTISGFCNCGCGFPF